MTRPVLWSFRRCPYAMRARLAIASAGVEVELREILLRDKPEAFLATSPKATVPVVEADAVIEESFDVMLWALQQSDPEGWLDMPQEGFALIEQADGPFKTALDRYKYAVRHADVDIAAERTSASALLQVLDEKLAPSPYLFGDTPRLADMAILPFVRQFAHVDLAWFSAQPWTGVIRWLEAFKASDRFGAIMTKYPPWEPDQERVIFPSEAA